MIRVAVADDHPLVLEGVRTVLAKAAAEVRIVGTASTGDGLLGMLDKTPADVAIVDISMPGPGILELLRRFDRPEEVETRQYVPRRFGLKETEGLVRRVLEGTASQPTRLRMVADELTGTLETILISAAICRFHSR